MASFSLVIGVSLCLRLPRFASSYREASASFNLFIVPPLSRHFSFLSPDVAVLIKDHAAAVNQPGAGEGEVKREAAQQIQPQRVGQAPVVLQDDVVVGVSGGVVE